MEANEQARFDTLYAQHLRALKLQGYSAGTIDVYARAVRRLTAERISQTTSHMEKGRDGTSREAALGYRGGVQKAVKALLAECGIKKRFPSIPCATVLPVCVRRTGRPPTCLRTV